VVVSQGVYLDENKGNVSISEIFESDGLEVLTFYTDS
jgi:hypothetical protein